MRIRNHSSLNPADRLTYSTKRAMKLHMSDHTANTTTGGQPQKGITTYVMSANRQDPLAGSTTKAFFNTMRRTRGQVLYFVPPFVGFYFLLEWANNRYVSHVTS